MPVSYSAEVCQMPVNAVADILNARSVAVVGATRVGEWGGGGFVAGLTLYGYKGQVYPINPKYDEIRGLKAYPSLRAIPGTVDYVISSIPAPQVPPMLEEAAEKQVKAVHLFTARLGETGRPDAIALQNQILEIARRSGFRLLGPNCMGVYYPAGGMSFHTDFPKETGETGLISQSGMLAREIVLAAPLKGTYFSKVFSYGNAIDLNECDFLDYLAGDPETRVIMMYIEGVKDGRRFLKTLQQATAVKPVIILKGGQGESGARATSSHTGSLAGASRVWDAMVAQSGAVKADSIEELVELAAAFRLLPPAKGTRVGVTGGAGGSSVLAADQCEKAGLDVISLPAAFREELRRRNVSVWDWLGNPADLSIREDDSLSASLIMGMMAKDPNFDVLIAITGMPGRPPGAPELPTEVMLEQQYALKDARQKPFAAVVAEKGLRLSDMDSREWRMLCDTRSALIKLGVPFFPTIARAASALRKAYDYYHRRDSA
jgi:acyl-CoA synthetase (NDP forming)